MHWCRDQGAARLASAVAGDQVLQLRLRQAAPNPVGLSSTDRVGQAGALDGTDRAYREGVVLVLGVVREERVVIGGHDLAAQRQVPPGPDEWGHALSPPVRLVRLARLAATEAKARRAKYALRACSARRRRSSGSSRPSGSTSASKRARNAVRPGAEVFRESCWACIAWAARRARRLRSAGEIAVRAGIGAGR